MNTTESILQMAGRLDRRIGARAQVDELDDDIRVVFGLPGGRFSGFRRAPSGLHRSLGLYRCRSCRQWWFLGECGSWTCQCCGVYDGNNGVMEQFTDKVNEGWIWNVLEDAS